MSYITARHSLLKRQSALQLRLEVLESDLHRTTGRHDILEVSASQTAHELATIERVLNKLGHDQNGCCQGCGKMIGTERLKVIPNARTCIGCARGH